LNTILITVLPVFGMIVLGYGLAKYKIIDEAAGRGISLFVFNVAIPALLFKTMANLNASDAAPWSLWASFYGGLAMIWILATLISRTIPSLNVSGGASASMASGFGNLALLGTPLALAHFGQAVAVPLGLIISVHSPALWFTATLHRELARQQSGFNWSKILKELANNLARNAIVLALITGTLWRFTGLGVNPVPEKMLQMLAEASVPTALVALGVSLASYSIKGSWDGMFAILALKMLLMPILVFGFAHFVFHLPPLWLKIAVLFAAMPTGANGFLFAQRNNEAVPAVSAAVAAGTGFAAITATALLYLMDAGYI
jgi:malonate transporter and related proteins